MTSCCCTPPTDAVSCSLAASAEFWTCRPSGSSLVRLRCLRGVVRLRYLRGDFKDKSLAPECLLSLCAKFRLIPRRWSRPCVPESHVLTNMAFVKSDSLRRLVSSQNARTELNKIGKRENNSRQTSFKFPLFIYLFIQFLFSFSKTPQRLIPELSKLAGAHFYSMAMLFGIRSLKINKNQFSQFHLNFIQTISPKITSIPHHVAVSCRAAPSQPRLAVPPPNHPTKHHNHHSTRSRDPTKQLHQFLEPPAFPPHRTSSAMRHGRR